MAEHTLLMPLKQKMQAEQDVEIGVDYITPDVLHDRLNEVANYASLYREWEAKPKEEQKKDCASMYLIALFLQSIDFRPLCPEKEHLLDSEYIINCIGQLNSYDSIVHCRGVGETLGHCAAILKRPSEVACANGQTLFERYQEDHGDVINDNQFTMSAWDGSHYPLSELYVLSATKLKIRLNFEVRQQKNLGQRVKTRLCPDENRLMDFAYVVACLDNLKENEVVLYSRGEEILAGCRVFPTKPSKTLSRIWGLNMIEYYAKHVHCYLDDNQFVVVAANGLSYPVSELFVVKIPSPSTLQEDAEWRVRLYRARVQCEPQPPYNRHFGVTDVEEPGNTNEGYDGDLDEKDWEIEEDLESVTGAFNAMDTN